MIALILGLCMSLLAFGSSILLASYSLALRLVSAFVANPFRFIGWLWAPAATPASPASAATAATTSGLLADRETVVSVRDHFRHTLVLNTVETEVLVFPAAADALVRAGQSGQQETIALMVCGNPGVAEFYLPFMRALWSQSGGLLTVMCVSHAGHSLWSRNNGRLFNLDEQIHHKLAFVRLLLSGAYDAHLAGRRAPLSSPSSPSPLSRPPGLDPGRLPPRLVLMGHSVGAHICLKIMASLDERDRQQVILSALLFPTIQHIGKTPNARHILPLTKIRPLLGHIVGGASLLVPGPLHRLLARLHLGWNEEPEIVDATRHLLHRSTISNVLWMAAHEFDEIVEWDERFIQAHLDRVVFYHGTSDGWVPLEHYHKTRAVFPSARAYLCDMGLEHAFVLGGGSAPMAGKVWDWIESAMFKLD